MEKYPEVDKLIAKVAEKDNFKVLEVLLKNKNLLATNGTASFGIHPRMKSWVLKPETHFFQNHFHPLPQAQITHHPKLNAKHSCN